jgi:hypothetical protein
VRIASLEVASVRASPAVGSYECGSWAGLVMMLWTLARLPAI